MLQEIKQGQRHILLNSIGEACGPLVHNEIDRAEVYLKEGGQNYDVMGWNQEQLINDILDQYEKHLHFLHLVR